MILSASIWFEHKDMMWLLLCGDSICPYEWLVPEPSCCVSRSHPLQKQQHIPSDSGKYISCVICKISACYNDVVLAVK